MIILDLKRKLALFRYNKQLWHDFTEDIEIYSHSKTNIPLVILGEYDFLRLNTFFIIPQ